MLRRSVSFGRSSSKERRADGWRLGRSLSFGRRRSSGYGPTEQQPQPLTEQDQPPMCIEQLPPELHLQILEWLDAATLIAANAVCEHWHTIAPVTARALMLAWFPEVKGMVCPNWLGALSSASRLGAARVQKATRDDALWAEWKALRTTQAKLLATGRGRLREFEHQQRQARQAIEAAFQPRGALHIQTELTTSYASSFQWKLDHRWPLEHAVPATLIGLVSTALAAEIRKILQSVPPSFPASVCAIMRAIVVRAWQQTEVAPPIYANLNGEFGLATEDP
eukprot:3402297-Prymnesium_polylepis.1